MRIGARAPTFLAVWVTPPLAESSGVTVTTEDVTGPQARPDGAPVATFDQMSVLSSNVRLVASWNS